MIPRRWWGRRPAPAPAPSPVVELDPGDMGARIRHARSTVGRTRIMLRMYRADPRADADLARVASLLDDLGNFVLIPVADSGEGVPG